jgi:hypothetical protein
MIPNLTMRYDSEMAARRRERYSARCAPMAFLSQLVHVAGWRTSIRVPREVSKSKTAERLSPSRF